MKDLYQNFQDKFHLSLKENIFLAKKHFSSLVYCGMKMENRNITFPQTDVILKGVNVGDVSLDDVCAVLGMKRALKVFFKEIENNTLTLDLLKMFNLYIAKDEAIESGVLRSGNVTISGTDYIPPIPKTDDVKNDIDKIQNSKISETEKALDLFLYLVRNQLFWDGNKRTALLGANFLLVQNGCGLFDIKEKDMLTFSTLLQSFFNTGGKGRH